MAELPQTKTKSLYFYMKRNLISEIKVTGTSELYKVHVKIRSFYIVYYHILVFFFAYEKVVEELLQRKSKCKNRYVGLPIRRFYVIRVKF